MEGGLETHRKPPPTPQKQKHGFKKNVLNALREKGAKRPLSWERGGWWFLRTQRKARETGEGTDP